jgi:sphingolipid delta-4 desaturase
LFSDDSPLKEHKIKKGVVKRIAAEYYDDLPYHTSWVKVIWDFIFDKNMGPHSRGVGYLKEEKTSISKNGHPRG